MTVAPTFRPTPLHCRRLREVWRSAGWPCCDMVEVELLCAGLLERVSQPSGHQTLRVTDAGVRLLGETLQRNRRARDAHEALVETVARAMTRAGRLAWRGLSLRARVGDDAARVRPNGDDGWRGRGGERGIGGAADGESAGGGMVNGVPSTDARGRWPPLLDDGGPFARLPTPADTGDGSGGRWVMAMPDVFSIRNTTVEAYLEPVVHEIKVRRADLLSDLRNAAKREAYLQLGGACWYVLADGIAQPHEVPAECGVIVAATDGSGALAIARPAPPRSAAEPFKMPLGVWMALARATPLPGWRDEEAQGLLGDDAAAAAGLTAGDPPVDAATGPADERARSITADPALARTARVDAGRESTP